MSAPLRASVAETGERPARRGPTLFSAERWKPWGPAVVWAGFIFAMSSDGMSAERTGSAIEFLLRAVFPWLSETSVGVLHFLIRKGAHFGEYFVFALLVEYGLRGGSGSRSGASLLLAFTIVALYALGDETHQLLVPSRTGSLRDCAIDILGATTALGVRRIGFSPLEPRWLSRDAPR